MVLFIPVPKLNDVILDVVSEWIVKPYSCQIDEILLNGLSKFLGFVTQFEQLIELGYLNILVCEREDLQALGCHAMNILIFIFIKDLGLLLGIKFLHGTFSVIHSLRALGNNVFGSAFGVDSGDFRIALNWANVDFPLTFVVKWKQDLYWCHRVPVMKLEFNLLSIIDKKLHQSLLDS